MSESVIVTGTTKKEKYDSLLPQVKALVEGETDSIANISNIIAALKFGLDLFWVGVYFVKDFPPALPIGETDDKQLVLGPFQGPVACTRISLGKGVCGTAWEQKKTIIVEDVDKFPGHIACSSLSRSEIVVPGFNSKGDVIFVLDVDSEHLASFDETDQGALEEIVKIISSCVNS
ncbi:MAG TPA: GAF domain-containing protein [Bacteroidia bacterium]|jgi:GAF domain-containing protein